MTAKQIVKLLTKDWDSKNPRRIREIAEQLWPMGIDINGRGDIDTLIGRFISVRRSQHGYRRDDLKKAIQSLKSLQAEVDLLLQVLELLQDAEDDDQ